MDLDTVQDHAMSNPPVALTRADKKSSIIKKSPLVLSENIFWCQNQTLSKSSLLIFLLAMSFIINDATMDGWTYTDCSQ